MVSYGTRGKRQNKVTTHVVALYSTTVVKKQIDLLALLSVSFLKIDKTISKLSMTAQTDKELFISTLMKMK